MLKDVCVNSVFPRTAKLWNSLAIEWFPLMYDIIGFKSRINTPFICRFFINRFPVFFNLLVFPCLEGIPIKKISLEKNKK